MSAYDIHDHLDRINEHPMMKSDPLVARMAAVQASRDELDKRNADTIGPYITAVEKEWLKVNPDGDVKDLHAQAAKLKEDCK
jgi:hypothetical protein